MELSKMGYLESRRKATTASAKEAASQGHEAVIQDEMLPWLTEYPETRFTSHVMEVITTMDHDTALMSKQCTTYHELSVGSTPYSKPNITFYSENPDAWLQNWHIILQRVFSRPKRVLPYNASFGIDYGDMERDEERLCVGSSSPNGKFVMMNFQDVEQMAYSSLSDKGLSSNVIPWEERHKIPVWRGSPWISGGDCPKGNETYEETIRLRPRRLLAVDFSMNHPMLLDAKFGRPAPHLGWKQPCWEKNATNGLYRLVNQVGLIEPKDYYSKYQVVLVLGGIGAAFRTSSHLRMGQAVVLADFEYEEWFAKYMEPWVHYIPLSRDLSDLNSTLHWVKDHPEKVKGIAKRGQMFYNDYLSFEACEEHVYEFVYRLSLYRHYNTFIANQSSYEMETVLPP
jgi:hypothetical protein